MERVKTVALEGLALLLVAGAGFVTYLFAYGDTSKSMAPRAASAAWTPSSETQIPAELVTYRFLYPDEPGGAAGSLILARFVDNDRVPSRTWESQSVEHWRGWTPGIFAREMQWVAEYQPGWQISRWLCADELAGYDRDHLFWSIQALRFLDPESTANIIDMIERSGKAARICLTQGRSDYDYDENTLYWNSTGADPLVTLARQLGHMWHDLCQNGDSTDSPERERIAVATEDRVREILSRKDPTRASIYNLAVNP